MTQNRPPKVRLEVEVHDKHQLELRSSLEFATGQTEQGLELDTFLFVPRNLGVAGGSFDKAQFYSDVTAHLRLTSRARGLKHLMNDTSRDAPLTKLREALHQLRSPDGMPESRPLASHAQLFAYLHTIAVTRVVRRLQKRLKKIDRDGTREDQSTFLDELAQTTDAISRSLWAFRRLRRDLWPFERLLHESVAESFWVADEHMSLVVEERLARLSASIDKCRCSYDGSGFGLKARGVIQKLAEAEALHRKKYGYATLPSAYCCGDSRYAEYFTYRRSLLKKGVQQALYLDARQVERDAFVRNSVGAVGAALAAIWAWTTQLPLAMADLPAKTKMMFFTMAVVAYVAKDRIKAFTNEYLPKKLRRYDHLWKIEGHSLAAMGFGKLDARIEETVVFQADAAVEPEIRAIRMRNRTVRLKEAAAPEEVIHYHKLFVQTAQKGEVLEYPRGYGVLDILRMNVQHFLHRLDDTEQFFSIYQASRRRFAQLTLPRVYHLNVVLRARGVANDVRSKAEFKHFRVVLNKAGIVRMEELR